MSVRAGLVAGGVGSALASAEAPRAEKAMIEFGITTQNEAAAFIAQVLHESVFLRYFEEIASGAAYEGRRDLGNTHAGDGRRYKGRGPIQLTGRSNYRAAGHALGLDLEGNPTLASGHDVGWRIAGWYWKTHGLDRYADGTQAGFDKITRSINGGLNGKASRDTIWRRARGVDCRPVKPDPWAGYTANEKRWMHEYDHLRAHGLDKPRQAVLRRVMTEQRKRVWHAAQKSGWDKMNRRARYNSLLARSR
jgi:predicted chitinase